MPITSPVDRYRGRAESPNSPLARSLDKSNRTRSVASNRSSSAASSPVPVIRGHSPKSPSSPATSQPSSPASSSNASALTNPLGSVKSSSAKSETFFPGTDYPLNPILPGKDALYIFANYATYSLFHEGYNTQEISETAFRNVTRLLDAARESQEDPENNVQLLHIKYNTTEEDPEDDIPRVFTKPFALLRDPVIKINCNPLGDLEPPPVAAIMEHITESFATFPRFIVYCYVGSMMTNQQIGMLSTWCSDFEPPITLYCPVETRFREDLPLEIALRDSIEISMYADPEGWMLGANNGQGEGDESGERAVMEEFDEGFDRQVVPDTLLTGMPDQIQDPALLLLLQQVNEEGESPKYRKTSIGTSFPRFPHTIGLPVPDREKHDISPAPIAQNKSESYPTDATPPSVPDWTSDLPLPSSFFSNLNKHRHSLSNSSSDQIDAAGGGSYLQGREQALRSFGVTYAGRGVSFSSDNCRSGEGLGRSSLKMSMSGPQENPREVRLGNVDVNRIIEGVQMHRSDIATGAAMATIHVSPSPSNSMPGPPLPRGSVSRPKPRLGKPLKLEEVIDALDLGECQTGRGIEGRELMMSLSMRRRSTGGSSQQGENRSLGSQNQNRSLMRSRYGRCHREDAPAVEDDDDLITNPETGNDNDRPHSNVEINKLPHQHPYARRQNSNGSQRSMTDPSENGSPRYSSPIHNPLARFTSKTPPNRAGSLWATRISPLSGVAGGGTSANGLPPINLSQYLHPQRDHAASPNEHPQPQTQPSNQSSAPNHRRSAASSSAFGSGAGMPSRLGGRRRGRSKARSMSGGGEAAGGAGDAGGGAGNGAGAGAGGAIWRDLFVSHMDPSDPEFVQTYMD